MCFSATASFTAAALLVPAGIYSAKKATPLNKPYWAIGLFPLLFGVQQALEGLVWLALGANDPQSIRFAALGFMLFSHFFWLFWVPIASAVLEPRGHKKNLFLALAIFGGLYGASMYLPLLVQANWLTVTLVQHSISYEAQLIYDGYVPRLALRVLYAVIVLSALLFSSDHYIRLFGILIAISVVAATVFFGYAFISVWCYFAALLSLYVFYMMRRITHEQSPRVDANPMPRPQG
jgi:hypothetical protein